MPDSSLCIGLDVGASKTTALVQEADGAVDTHRGPGANPKQVGWEAVTTTLTDLIGEALDQRPVPEALFLCAGVAGAGRSADQSTLTTRLHRALADSRPSVQVEVVSDVLIALETAFGPESGLVAIAGTGSVGMARTEAGELRRVGGWGPRLGDAGSGYAVGRAGLRAVAAAADGGPDTALCSRVAARFDVHGRGALLQALYADAFSPAAAAPLVVEAAAEGDPVASRILDTQAAELARQLRWLADRCSSVRPRIGLFGGMTRSAPYADRLCRAIHDCLPTWSVDLVPDAPATGALKRARRAHEAAHESD